MTDQTDSYDLQDVIRTEFDTRRFEEMMNSTERRAYSMALQLTRNPSEAEDLVQDTFVKAWKGFDSYHPGRPFLNWLLRIMQRAYLDTRRRDNPIRKADSLNSMISPNDGEVQELPIPDPSPTPDEEAVYAEFSNGLRNALSELPAVYRESIELCDLEGMTYQEIAEIQGATIGTVRSRIHRGRKMLRDVVTRRGITLPRGF
ncbi:MAG: sigma-70 family RNA polymerase sigma factor [Armatimonadetes bacterium]|nr:sigma-70 family RNA polymerase sigma factor [Armatimonadota bacterium]